MTAVPRSRYKVIFILESNDMALEEVQNWASELESEGQDHIFTEREDFDLVEVNQIYQSPYERTTPNQAD